MPENLKIIPPCWVVGIRTSELNMILSRFGMEEGAKNVTSPFIEVWMFEPQKSLSFFLGD